MAARMTNNLAGGSPRFFCTRPEGRGSGQIVSFRLKADCAVSKTLQRNYPFFLCSVFASLPLCSFSIRYAQFYDTSNRGFANCCSQNRVAASCVGRVHSRPGGCGALPPWGLLCRLIDTFRKAGYLRPFQHAV